MGGLQTWAGRSILDVYELAALACVLGARMRGVAISVALLLGGCVLTPTQPTQASRETIFIRVGGGPFCFPCMYDELSIRGDGRITWKLRSWNGVTRERKLLASRIRHVPPEQLVQIQAALSVYRPRGPRLIGGEGECVQDQGDATITWNGRPEDRLIFELGCGGAEISRLKATVQRASELAGVELMSW